jgi:3-oxoacyl-[acyl-carrier protein] reductase
MGNRNIAGRKAHLNPAGKCHMELLNRKAIITGACGGFGRELSLTFAKEGADIALVDIKKEELNNLAAKIAALGRKALPIFADISKEKDVNKLVAKTIGAFGRIDILINNAGLARSANIQDITLQEWNRLINVNLTGTFLCCRAVISYMIKQNYGKIVNLASISGQTGRMVGVDYSASKSGIVGITRTLALQVAANGINVNAVAPGPVITPLFEKNFAPEVVEKLKASIPYKRQGTPQDIANLILFLASDKAEWITGEAVAINGGAFMG